MALALSVVLGACVDGDEPPPGGDFVYACSTPHDLVQCKEGERIVLSLPALATNASFGLRYASEGEARLVFEPAAAVTTVSEGLFVATSPGAVVAVAREPASGRELERLDLWFTEPDSLVLFPKDRASASRIRLRVGEKLDLAVRPVRGEATPLAGAIRVETWTVEPEGVLSGQRFTFRSERPGVATVTARSGAASGSIEVEVVP